MTRRASMLCIFAFTALVPLTVAPAAHAQSVRPRPSEQRRLAQKRRALEAQLAAAQLKYTDMDPRVKSLQSQVEEARRLSPPAKGEKMKRTADTRAALEAKLAEARLKYTDANPRVRTLQAQVDALNDA